MTAHFYRPAARALAAALVIAALAHAPTAAA
jgi:hypothetical protein